jgi:hypothetical protein
VRLFTMDVSTDADAGAEKADGGAARARGVVVEDVCIGVVCMMVLCVMVYPLLCMSGMHHGLSAWVAGGDGMDVVKDWVCDEVNDFLYDGADVVDANRMDRLEFAYDQETTRVCLRNVPQVSISDDPRDVHGRRTEMMSMFGGVLVCEHTTPGYLVVTESRPGDLSVDPTWRHGKYHLVDGAGSGRVEDDAVYRDPRVWNCRDKATGAYAVVGGVVTCEQVPWRDGSIVVGSCSMCGPMRARKQESVDATAAAGVWTAWEEYAADLDVSWIYTSEPDRGMDLTGWSAADSFVWFDRGLNVRGTDAVYQRTFRFDQHTNTEYTMNGLQIRSRAGDGLALDILRSRSKHLECILMDGFEGVFMPYVSTQEILWIEDGADDGPVETTAVRQPLEDSAASLASLRAHNTATYYFGSTDILFEDPRPWQCGYPFEDSLRFGGVHIVCERAVLDSDILHTYEESCVLYI